jgi:hypothetical protein
MSCGIVVELQCLCQGVLSHYLPSIVFCSVSDVRNLLCSMRNSVRWVCDLFFRVLGGVCDCTRSSSTAITTSALCIDRR